VLFSSIAFSFASKTPVHWTVSDGKPLLPTTCIVLDASDVVIHLMLNNTELSTNIRESNTSGSCVPSNQNLDVAFYPTSLTDNGTLWHLKMNFTRNENNSFQLTFYSLEGVVYNETDKGSKTPFHFEMSREAQNDTKTSTGNLGFQCSTVALALTNNSRIAFTAMKLAAYANFSTGDFPTNYNFQLCPLDERTSDIVPIVVGACLAALVIVVLIAYLIGRARAKRQGYASV